MKRITTLRAGLGFQFLIAAWMTFVSVRFYLAIDHGTTKQVATWGIILILLMLAAGLELAYRKLDEILANQMKEKYPWRS